MIARMTGILVEKQAPYLLLDVRGVTYELETSMNTYFSLPDQGQSLDIYCQLVIREDGHYLYGFKDQEEKRLFRALIKTSGVGPRLALSILSSMTVHQFVQAIGEDDTGNLVRIPGIGKKTAQRLMLDLRDRLKDWGIDREGNQTIVANDPQHEAISALLALGYKSPEANRMVQSVQQQDDDSEQLIRKALQTTLK